MTETTFPGLTPKPRSDWPDLIQTSSKTEVISRLKPNSEEHRRVLDHMLTRIHQSEIAMSKFYPRWNTAEKKVQAYVDLPAWEKELKDANDAGKPAAPVRITVPYTYATISTIVAFLMHTFTGRRPFFQVGSHKEESMDSARNMELTLQYNADHTRLVRQLYQFFMDGETYGVCIMKVAWQETRSMRTVRKEQPQQQGFFSGLFSEPKLEWVKTREEHLVYSGNDVTAQDPFMFFPDPRVPMAEVAKRGEYAFWRAFEGIHTLKRLEASGEFMWIDEAGGVLPKNFTGGDSERAVISMGRAHPGAGLDGDGGGGYTGSSGAQGKNYVQVDQGTIDIIPRELGLSASESVEKWIFTVLNKKQVVQAAKLEDDHGMHPVVVAEPYSLGYGFGQPSMADFLGPLQDIVSWYVNSHIDNVRRVLNDIIIVDPSAIELQDLKDPGPGSIIRLKRAAHGRDVKTIIQQLQVNDVTSGHMRDAELMMTIGQRLSAVTDNFTGISSNAGGRRTATEVRTRTEGAASRLSAHARLYSAMSIVDLTEMMSLNIQQYMDDDFYLELLGADGARDSILIRPEMLVGDFHYPVHDGTLPLDKIALFEVWTQLFSQVQTDPGLRQQYSIGKFFEHIAELGGVKNVESFRISIKPDQEIEADAQAGNLIPAGNGASGGGGGAGQNARLAQLPNLSAQQAAQSLG